MVIYFLQSRTIVDVLQQWQYLGIFDYALPFLLIFAFVFALLSKIKAFEGSEFRGVRIVIALAVALLSLQFNLVSNFFAVLMPRLGIGLGVLLAIMILLGLFFDLERIGPSNIFMYIGAAIALVVVLSSFSSYDWWLSSFWRDNISAIISFIIIAVFFGIVAGSGEKTRGVQPTTFWEKKP